jgi:hypothetical protein
MAPLRSAWGGFYPREVRAGKGKRRVPKHGAGNRVAKPDIGVFSAEFAFGALETGDFMTI